MVNIDEARSIAAIMDESVPDREVTEVCISTLKPKNSEKTTIVANGLHGAYGYANHV